MAQAAKLPFQHLTPDRIMAAVEHAGWRCDGRLMALNSFENRVYQIGIEDGAPIVAKFSGSLSSAVRRSDRASRSRP